MDTKKYLELINHPENTTPEDLLALEELAEKYPFSQSIHVLIAKAGSILESEPSQKKITKAAIYTTHRAILKKYILSGVEEKNTHETATTTTSKTEADTITKTTAEDTATTIGSSTVMESKPSNTIAEKVTIENPQEENKQDKPEDQPAVESMESQNLEENFPAQFKDKAVQELQTVKKEVIQNKKVSFKNLEINTKANQTTSFTHPAKPEEDENESFYKEIRENLEKLKRQKESFIAQENLENNNGHSTPNDPLQKEDASSTGPASNSDSAPGDKSTVEFKERDTENELLLDYLENLDDQKQEGLNLPKQKEQFELIEKFIESSKKNNRLQPNPALKNEPQEDLSDRYSEIGDHLISENLAVIMIKQNKIEKAIDIYKKLIWKFPQKKAYFANRIEELKNK